MIINLTQYWELQVIIKRVDPYFNFIHLIHMTIIVSKGKQILPGKILKALESFCAQFVKCSDDDRYIWSYFWQVVVIPENLLWHVDPPRCPWNNTIIESLCGSRGLCMKKIKANCIYRKGRGLFFCLELPENVEKYLKNTMLIF